MLWLLIGYMYLFIHRPFEVWPALGEIRLELLYALFTGAAWLMYPGKRWLPNPLNRAMLAFVLALLTCWVVSPWSDLTVGLMDKYLKQLFFYLLLVTVVHEEKGLERVVKAFFFITTFYMVHSLWQFAHGRHHFRMGIVRLIGVDTTISDPNAFAASLVYATTLAPAAWFASTSRLWRCYLLGHGLLTAGCVALTGSRSGFVAMLLWIGLAMLRSRWRYAFIALAVVSAPFVWCALPPSLQNRFETIINPDVGPRNAQESAEGRVQGFYLGIKLLEENPLTGCGPGAWRPATGKKIESHNLYGQVMGELGLLGVITFGALVLCTWLNTRRIARVYREHPEWERGFVYHLGWCLALALFLLLVLGNFGHSLYRYNWIWFGAFSIVARYCVEQRLARAAGTVPLPAAAAAAPARGGLSWGGAGA